MGKVVSVRVDGLLAEVIVGAGKATTTAIITASAVPQLKLKKGDSAAYDRNPCVRADCHA